MKWGLKGGISINTDSGPLGYVLWCCGNRSQDFFTFIQIGSGHTVSKMFKRSRRSGKWVESNSFQTEEFKANGDHLWNPSGWPCSRFAHMFKKSCEFLLFFTPYPPAITSPFQKRSKNTWPREVSLHQEEIFFISVTRLDSFSKT